MVDYIKKVSDTVEAIKVIVVEAVEAKIICIDAWHIEGHLCVAEQWRRCDSVQHFQELSVVLAQG